MSSTSPSSSWCCRRYVWQAFIFFFLFHSNVAWSWSLRANHNEGSSSKAIGCLCFTINNKRGSDWSRSFPPVDQRRRRDALQASSSSDVSLSSSLLLLWRFGNWWKRNNNKGRNHQLQQPQPPREIAPGEIRIRRADPSDIRVATDLLTEAFFSNNTNFFTYPWEWLYTYLSLDSDFPQLPTEQHRDPHDILLAEYLPTPTVVVSRHQATTASTTTAKNDNNIPNKQPPPPLPPSQITEEVLAVVGMVQVDGRRGRLSWGRPMTLSSSSSSSTTSIGPSSSSYPEERPEERPVYLCNLAVRELWRRRGVATLLIQAGEQLVRDEYQATHLCLKVRRNTPNVIALYQKLGYVIFQPPPLSSSMAERPDPLQRTRREDESIWWMGKQLEQQEGNEMKETKDALAETSDSELVNIPDD